MQSQIILHMHNSMCSARLNKKRKSVGYLGKALRSAAFKTVRIDLNKTEIAIVNDDELFDFLGAIFAAPTSHSFSSYRGIQSKQWRAHIRKKGFLGFILPPLVPNRRRETPSPRALPDQHISTGKHQSYGVCDHFTVRIVCQSNTIGSSVEAESSKELP